MLAMKCDRCGAFYDPYTVPVTLSTGTENVNGISLLYGWIKDGKYDSYISNHFRLALCPSCMNKIVEILNPKEGVDADVE